MATISLRQAWKRYGPVEAVRDISFDIPSGGFTVIVGPSGCGKSTLLRMIAGLEDISEGELLLDGKRMNDVDAANRGMAMVFQSYALYPHMSVRENMSFSLRIQRMPKVEIAQRVRNAAESLQIEALLDRKPRQLSGGQRQRVAIGRAIVRDPKVFLFDEPLSNLDADLRVQMRVELARLHGKLRNTMVYVTHDQVEAMTLATQIVVMRAGRIEQIGTPQQLYDDPANLFVAGFIGTPRTNALAGNVTADKRIELTAGPSIHAASLQHLPAGAKVHVTVRPELMDRPDLGPPTSPLPDASTSSRTWAGWSISIWHCPPANPSSCNAGRRKAPKWDRTRPHRSASPICGSSMRTGGGCNDPGSPGGSPHRR